jgi:hypothetical protein
MITDLQRVICPKENGGKEYDITYRQNILIVEKPDGQIVLKCSEPQSLKERTHNPNPVIRTLQTGKAVRFQYGSNFQNMKAVTLAQEISDKERDRLLLPFGRKKGDDYTATISVSDRMIGSITARNGRREAVVSYSDDTPGQIFEAKSFLRYEADDYEISIHENEASYWLVTDYEYEGNFFQTSEVLKPISFCVSQNSAIERLAS